MYFGDYNKLKDYITNLQEENERLEDFNIKLQATKDRLDRYYRENQIRIDKAIEYIEDHIIEDSEYENYMQCEREEKEKLIKEAKDKNTTLSLLVRAKLFKNN